MLTAVARASTHVSVSMRISNTHGKDLLRMRSSTCSSNSKGQDEHNDPYTSVHHCREKVVVSELPSWVLPWSVVLDKAEDEVNGYTGVDADANVAEVPADQRGVEVVQAMSSAVSYDVVAEG